MRLPQDNQSTPRHITPPWHIKFLFEKKPGVPITFWQGLFIGFLGMVTHKMFASQGEGEEQNSIVSGNTIIWTFAFIVVIFPLLLRANYDRLQRNTNTAAIEKYCNAPT